MRDVRPRLSIVALLAVLCSGLSGWAAPGAEAQTDIGATYDVQYLGNTDNHVNRSDPIGYCSVNAPGLSCAIAQTKSYTFTITTDLGVDAEVVKASIGVSASETVSVTATCTSPNIQPGQFFYAYPTETYYNYRVYKHVPEITSENGQFQAAREEVSPNLVSKIPDGGVRCELR